MMSLLTPSVGCAGWSLRKDLGESFALGGTHLERYARQLNCVEINSSFYRPHRRSTYERWASSTPGDFRFSVKLPKQITHIGRLTEAAAQIEQFLDQVGGLGEKLGPILAQLPPSLRFETGTAEQFF